MANFNSIEEILEDIRQGKMVIIVDDEDRENEGDLLMAASKVTAEDVNFMATHGRGLICLTLTRQRCKQIQLPLMVDSNNAEYGTNFTVSIEAAEGVTTGISAGDRAVTIQAAVAEDAKPMDIVQPGHIFPLMAQAGGVLTRAGHTEAGCDLSRIAGLEPAAVIVEILNEDGTMARRSDLEAFAEKFDLKIGTIADLIEYRLKNEHSVEKVSDCNLPTTAGDFRLEAYQDGITGQVHLAMIKGEIDPDEAVLVRVHMENSFCDMLDAQMDDCGWPLNDVMQRIDKEGKGVIVILRSHETSNELINRIDHYQKLQKGELSSHPGQTKDLRTYGLGAQILKSVGVKRMKVMSAPKKIHGLSGFGLEVSEYYTGA
ncbi:MAG: bifunctional 3,4-dihydroxy-2-butanone-4-phosphate synthase/GTP cyclohydrolase II [Gammaproteobacteria bacterium]|nr:bifunctional 3,4-dihydroxy-2-butanone-4-phosphate synthase/GTP cyclohydrolase II [Gammaproteobacteria bacterium]